MVIHEEAVERAKNIRRRFRKLEKVMDTTNAEQTDILQGDFDAEFLGLLNERDALKQDMLLVEAEQQKQQQAKEKMKAQDDQEQQEPQMNAQKEPQMNVPEPVITGLPTIDECIKDLAEEESEEEKEDLGEQDVEAEQEAEEEDQESENEEEAAEEAVECPDLATGEKTDHADQEE